MAAKNQYEFACFYIYIKELSNHNFMTSFPRRIFLLSFFLSSSSFKKKEKEMLFICSLLLPLYTGLVPKASTKH